MLAALVFAQRLRDLDSIERALATFAAFVLCSAATYLINDVADRARDLAHPEKRLRPIAAGALSVFVATLAAILCASAGLALAFAINTPTGIVVTGYLALQAAYSGFLKRLVIVDLFCIAAGFVLRVVAGASAIAVPVSNWLYVCMLLVSLFLALGKRRAELELIDAGSHRENLNEYSLALIDQLIAVVAGATIVCYSLYTMSAETIAKFGHDRLKFTIPFVLYGLFRYLYLVHRRGAGAAPERVLTSDVALILDLGLYACVAVWAIYLR